MEKRLVPRRGDANMNKSLEGLQPGMVIKTKNGWWVKIGEIFEDEVTGFFATDLVSVIVPTARYPAKWRRNGEEITDPEKPHPGLLLEPEFFYPT